MNGKNSLGLRQVCRRTQRDPEGQCLCALVCQELPKGTGVEGAQLFPRSPRCHELTEALGPLHRRLLYSEELLQNGPYYSF